MSCEEARVAMMGYLDRELPPAESEAVRAHAGACAACGVELAKYASLVAFTKSLRLREPSDAERERFFRGLRNRMERRTAWVLLVCGAATLAAAAATGLVLSDAIPPFVRAGLLVLGVGLFLLFSSVVRLHLRSLPFDRYRSVVR